MSTTAAMSQTTLAVLGQQMQATQQTHWESQQVAEALGYGSVGDGLRLGVYLTCCPDCSATVPLRRVLHHQAWHRNGRLPARARGEDYQRCGSCGDNVYVLSSRGWCDGCEEQADRAGSPAG